MACIVMCYYPKKDNNNIVNFLTLTLNLKLYVFDNKKNISQT